MFTSPKLDAVKARLATLSFAQVNLIVGKNADVESFVFNGRTVLSSDPDAPGIRARFTTVQWNGTIKTYSKYFGFAITGETKDAYFCMNRQSTKEDYCGLGVNTSQNNGIPPIRGMTIVGTFNPDHPHGPRFPRWAICTPQERIFAGMLLGTTPMHPPGALLDEQIESLFIKNGRGQYGYLCSCATLLVLKDLDFFIMKRLMDNAEDWDARVKEVCQHFELDELWKHYAVRAHETGTFSSMIAESAYEPLVIPQPPLVMRAVAPAMPYITTRYEAGPPTAHCAAA